VGDACDHALWVLLGDLSAWDSISRDVADVSKWLTGGDESQPEEPLPPNVGDVAEAAPDRS